MKTITSGRYAAVTSTLALVVALGGTSYAAVRITGRDIKDGTVTTADVKNHNLQLKDFSATAKTGLKGAKGSPGAPGAPGAPGDSGDPGPSNGYAMPPAVSTTIGLSSTPTVLGTLSLPAGSYLANAKTAVIHNDGALPQTAAGITTCEIQIPGGAGPATDLDATSLRMPTGTLLSSPMALQAGFTLDSAQDLQFVCSTTGTNNGGTSPQFQAVEVATLTVQQ